MTRSRLWSLLVATRLGSLRRQVLRPAEVGAPVNQHALVTTTQHRANSDTFR